MFSSQKPKQQQQQAVFREYICKSPTYGSAI